MLADSFWKVRIFKEKLDWLSTRLGVRRRSKEMI
jgi:hypothetical protein